MISCPKCSHSFYPTHDSRGHVADALRELVELKRMKDSGQVTPEYERRKLIAWRNAFEVLDVMGDPK